MYKYAIEIFYSEEDNGYIAIIPELPGCSAFGENEDPRHRRSPPTVGDSGSRCLLDLLLAAPGQR